MAGLATQERLQPSLLDRLRDDEPHRPRDPGGLRSIDAAQLRRCIGRDIGWLLNCIRHRAASTRDGEPVAQSVFGFGLPDLAGMNATGIDPDALGRAVRAAIVRFEPRLVPETLHVDVDLDRSSMGRRTLSFRIESVMWAQPMPVAIRLDTEADLETLRFAVDRETG